MKCGHGRRNRCWNQGKAEELDCRGKWLSRGLPRPALPGSVLRAIGNMNFSHRRIPGVKQRKVRYNRFNLLGCFPLHGCRFCGEFPHDQDARALRAHQSARQGRQGGSLPSQRPSPRIRWQRCACYIGGHRPDGKRSLMIKPPGSTTPAEGGLRKINIVLNWLEELKQRLGHRESGGVLKLSLQ